MQPGRNPAIRASDVDRDQVLAQLSTHYQAGRLTMTEFDERSSQALQARTLGDLDQLLTDLPPAPAAQQPPMAGPAQAPAGRRDVGAAVAFAVLAVLAVGVLIGLLSHTGHSRAGGLGAIIPALIVWRLLAGRRRRE
jgi:uncharacterized protein DUF1707